MIVDIIFAVFLLLTVIAGYLAGGFREILKFLVFIAVFLLFNVPSLQSAMQQISGKGSYTGFFIICFLIVYAVLYQILYFSLKGLITEKEGLTGGLNKILGVIFGFLRGILILIVMIFIFEALLKRGIFVEFRESAYDSLFYSVVRSILDKTGFLFF